MGEEREAREGSLYNEEVSHYGDKYNGLADSPCISPTHASKFVWMTCGQHMIWIEWDHQ